MKNVIPVTLADGEEANLAVGPHGVYIATSGSMFKGGRTVASDTRVSRDGSMFTVGTVTVMATNPEEAAEFQQALEARMPPPTQPKHSDADARTAFFEDIGVAERFQYAVVNTGSFNTPERLAGILARAGEVGWELITVYDKSSNWFQGMEKGFALMKRAVPSGVEVDNWCVRFNN